MSRLSRWPLAAASLGLAAVGVPFAVTHLHGQPPAAEAADRSVERTATTVPESPVT